MSSQLLTLIKQTIREAKEISKIKNLYGSALYKAIIAKCDSYQKIKFQRFVSRLENDETDPLTDEEIDDKIRAWHDRNIRT